MLTTWNYGYSSVNDAYLREEDMMAEGSEVLPKVTVVIFATVALGPIPLSLIFLSLYNCPIKLSFLGSLKPSPHYPGGTKYSFSQSHQSLGHAVTCRAGCAF